MRFDLGAGARYLFFNETAIVPFVGLGVALHWWKLTMPPPPPGGMRDKVSMELTLGFNGVAGAQIELARWVGIEIGAAFDFTLGFDTFRDPLFWITPFAGVTIYAL
jgi:hypothetical protein